MWFSNETLQSPIKIYKNLKYPIHLFYQNQHYGISFTAN